MKSVIQLALVTGIGTVGIMVMLKFGVAAVGALLTFVGGVGSNEPVATGDNAVKIKAGKLEVSWSGAARVGMIAAGLLLIVLAIFQIRS